MRVFVTGASGFIGSAVVKELLNAGHQVLGLARSDASAQAIKAAGAEVLRGSLTDLESLKRGAAETDGIIHLAFIHDFSQYKENCETDRVAIETMGEALAGTNKPMVVTSGTGMIAGTGRIGIEKDQPQAGSDKVPRVASEEAAATVADRGVAVSVVRLPPSVHGAGDQGFIPMIINVARQKGVSAYIGEGQNRWPSVHRLDAAKVFRLALEQGAKYPAFHAIGDEGIPTKSIAEVIGKHLHLPVKSITPDEATAHFGWMGNFLSMDAPAAAPLTKEVLGWEPTQAGLIADMEENYFKQ